MARLSRKDSPGAWHHVMNRGIARRSVFEDRSCVRYFLSRLARVVRKGDLEVHCFVLLTNHYHLLVRSPRGRLSESLRLVQNQFVRWFNRRSRRDGPLFRGRFLSKPVESLEYRRLLVRYIDQNPVLSGLAARPEEYPYGSARRYAFETGPPWLERCWVERDSQERARVQAASRLAYRRAFGEPLAAHEVELVEARLNHPAAESDPLDDLVHSAPASVLLWMERKAALADGTRPGLPCASATRVLNACSHAETRRPACSVLPGGKQVSAWGVLEIALLRDIAGLRWSEISARVSLGESSVKRRYRIHREWMTSGGEYRQIVSLVANECLRG